MATVVVLRSRHETANPSTTVTTANFRSWKRKRGRNTAFVVQLPGADEEDDDGNGGALVCTFADMCRLPTGSYRAQLVRKCAIPDEAKKELRGSDLWKCV